MTVLLRRGPAAARHAMPFLHASAPGTRRAVAGLLAVTGDASAIPILRQAIARERDARTRVQLTSALEKLSGAEPLVPKTTGEDILVARARAALMAPRQPKPPAWLAGTEMPRLLWRDGEPVTRAEIDALAGRLALQRATHVDAIVPDVRRALDPASATHAPRRDPQGVRRIEGEERVPGVAPSIDRVSAPRARGRSPRARRSTTTSAPRRASGGTAVRVATWSSCGIRMRSRARRAASRSRGSCIGPRADRSVAIARRRSARSPLRRARSPRASDPSRCSAGSVSTTKAHAGGNPEASSSS